jgi:biopolymer transport protein ExbD
MKKRDHDMKQRKKRREPINHTPFIIILFFLLLVIAGVAVNETDMVLEQATKVCLSCIGIG